MFYQMPTKYIYLEPTRRDLQNSVKILSKKFCLFLDLKEIVFFFHFLFSFKNF